ncbi:hypothetical protein L596_024990 [Steinernema carpocapsae]|uniref:Uncharacterized protein n=1 Tax=Steinernema carpocapsae TaxID=34508 RepID=A0A4U5M7B2_STECR|nr:hypothetical protein L596_024990 [Steinernema carpocapsae]
MADLWPYHLSKLQDTRRDQIKWGFKKAIQVRWTLAPGLPGSQPERVEFYQTRRSAAEVPSDAFVRDGR